VTRKTGGKRDLPIISTKKVLNCKKCCVWKMLPKCKIQESSYWTNDSGGHEKMTISDISEIYVALIFKILNWCTMISNKELLWSVFFCAARSCDAGRGSWSPSGGNFLQLRGTTLAWNCNQRVSMGQHCTDYSGTCNFWLNVISCGSLVAALWHVGTVDWIMSDWRWNNVVSVKPSVRPSFGRQWKSRIPYAQGKNWWLTRSEITTNIENFRINFRIIKYRHCALNPTCLELFICSTVSS
jgi:hypothetical protein